MPPLPGSGSPTGVRPKPPTGQLRGGGAMPRARIWLSDVLELSAIRWTLIYVGFMGYIFATVTYRLPIANVAMAAALVGLAFQPRKFRFPPLIALFGLYLLWSAFGYLSTDYPAVVQERLIEYGKLWLIVLVAVNALRSRAQVRFFLVFFLVCFITHPARGAIVNYFAGYTVWGRALWNHIYGNPNDLAALALFPLSIAAGLMVSDRNRWVRWGAIASAAVLPVLVLMTQSRGGFLALALFASLALLGQRRKLRALAVVSVFAAAAVMVSPGGVWDRVGGIAGITSEEGRVEADAEGSATQRYEIWEVAVAIIGDHGFTGVGLGAYRHAHARYAAELPHIRTARGRRDTHSTYLNVLAESGYPGFLLFFGMIGAVMWRAEKVRRRAARRMPGRAAQIWYLEAGLLAYLAAGIFGSFPHLAFLHVQLATLMVLTELAAGEHRRLRSSRRTQRTKESFRGFGPDRIRLDDGTQTGQAHIARLRPNDADLQRVPR